MAAHSLIGQASPLLPMQDIDPLASLPKLQMLSLMGNPVALKLNYRLYVISKCPGLKILDFKKVRSKVRKMDSLVLHMRGKWINIYRTIFIRIPFPIRVPRCMPSSPANLGSMLHDE